MRALQLLRVHRVPVAAAARDDRADHLRCWRSRDVPDPTAHGLLDAAPRGLDRYYNGPGRENDRQCLGSFLIKQ